MKQFNDKILIYAGIVSYNPDIFRLEENIDAIYSQVDKLIIVDNKSKNLEEIENIIIKYKNIIFIKNNINLGIARALNQIMEKSLCEQADWVLTLDQDSVVSASLVSQYRQYLNLPNIGMLTCVIKDRNTKGNTFKKFEREYEEVQKCYTSGCLTKVSAWNISGRFDEKMFIDYVDYDMCMSLKECGYKIIRINQIGLLHELGKSRDVKFFGKKYVVSNHAPKRKYFIVRNWLYYNRKHSKILNLKKEYKSLVRFIVFTIIYEPNKFSNGKAMLQGIFDAKKMVPKSKEDLKR